MSLFVKVSFIFLIVLVMLSLGLISYIEILNTQDGGYEKGDGKKRGKIFKRLFIKRFLDVFASLGLIFFIVSHLYGIPIVCRMRRHEKKVVENIFTIKPRKGKNVNIKDYPVKYSHYKGIPGPTVHAS